MNLTLATLPPKKANLQIFSGLGLLITAEIFMFWGIEPFPFWFYPFAWWSYILIIDGIIYRLQGNSLILSRRQEFLVMLPWSVAFWLFFEMANLRMENWHYVNVTSHQWFRWFGYFISFATVLPGIFETTELLGCFGLYAKIKNRSFILPKSFLPIFSFGGACFLISPFLFPRYCFPFIWLSFIFLLEPINYRYHSHSLIREWEEGKPRNFFLFLTAGIICGFLWEFWNFWARTKWVYGVPFFHKLKIFEMPLAGFLGFPPFAVECFVMYNFISLFRFKRNWDKESYLRAPDRKISRYLLLALAVIIISFYVLAFRSLDRYTVKSYIPPFTEIPLPSDP